MYKRLVVGGWWRVGFSQRPSVKNGYTGWNEGRFRKPRSAGVPAAAIGAAAAGAVAAGVAAAGAAAGVKPAGGRPAAAQAGPRRLPITPARWATLGGADADIALSYWLSGATSARLRGRPADSGGAMPLGYGVIGSPTGSGPVSLGSSPGTPAGYTALSQARSRINRLLACAIWPWGTFGGRVTPRLAVLAARSESCLPARRSARPAVPGGPAPGGPVTSFVALSPVLASSCGVCTGMRRRKG